MTADCLDALAPLADQHVAGAEDHGGGLLSLALHRNEAHGRALRGLASASAAPFF